MAFARAQGFTVVRCDISGLAPLLYAWVDIRALPPPGWSSEHDPHDCEDCRVLDGEAEYFAAPGLTEAAVTIQGVGRWRMAWRESETGLSECDSLTAMGRPITLFGAASRPEGGPAVHAQVHVCGETAFTDIDGEFVIEAYLGAEEETCEAWAEHRSGYALSEGPSVYLEVPEHGDIAGIQLEAPQVPDWAPPPGTPPEEVCALARKIQEMTLSDPDGALSQGTPGEREGVLQQLATLPACAGG